MLDETVRGCPSCGKIADTLEEWARHMVNIHDVGIEKDEQGEWKMTYPVCEARA